MPAPKITDVRVLRRFEKFFDGSDTSTDACWPWQSSRSGDGYGLFSMPFTLSENGESRMEVASRVAWRLYKGEIPKGLMIRHTCDNPPCVRLSHLLIGTNFDNSQDAIERGRQKPRTVSLIVRPHDPDCRRLTVDEAASIAASSRTLKQIANDYGVDLNVIRHIKLKAYAST